MRDLRRTRFFCVFIRGLPFWCRVSLRQFSYLLVDSLGDARYHIFRCCKTSHNKKIAVVAELADALDWILLDNANRLLHAVASKG